MPDIAKAVDLITEKLHKGGRLIYFGAGTSGRLQAFWTPPECSPTFGVDTDLITANIAGGKEAMFRSFENAEDSKEMGLQDAVAAKITDADVVVGMQPPAELLMCGALEHAAECERDHNRYRQFRRTGWLVRRQHHSCGRRRSLDRLDPDEKPAPLKK